MCDCFIVNDSYLPFEQIQLSIVQIGGLTEFYNKIQMKIRSNSSRFSFLKMKRSYNCFVCVVLLGRYSSGRVDGRVAGRRDDSSGRHSYRSGNLPYGSFWNLG